MKHRLVHRAYARFPRLRRIAMDVLFQIEAAGLGGHKDPKAMAVIRNARRARESLLSANEAFTLYSMARAQRALPGAMAEVGVFQGCSARIISEASGGRPLHLFDTFEGLPTPGSAETGHLRPAQYSSSLDGVRAFLHDCPNISFHPGLFPASARFVEQQRFSFVHLDVDLKSSTASALEFFYQRLTPGGMILTHDYSYLDGVREAFDEFCADHQCPVIELSTSQAVIVRHMDMKAKAMPNAALANAGA